MESTTPPAGVWVSLVYHPRSRRMRMRFDRRSGDLKLTLPRRTPMRAVKAFLAEEQAWIAKNQQKVLSPKPLTEGAEIPIKGRLHVVRRTGKLRGLATFEESSAPAGQPIVWVPGLPEQTESKLIRALKVLASDALHQSVRRYTDQLGASMPKISLRDTRSRWGSCSSRGTMSFCWRLIMAPETVLDYVAAHEAAHLKEMNHSASFWQVVKDLDPDYLQSEAWLKKHGAELHYYGSGGIKAEPAAPESKERFYFAFS